MIEPTSIKDYMLLYAALRPVLNKCLSLCLLSIFSLKFRASCKPVRGSMIQGWATSLALTPNFPCLLLCFLLAQALFGVSKAPSSLLPQGLFCAVVPSSGRPPRTRHSPLWHCHSFPSQCLPVCIYIVSFLD